MKNAKSKRLLCAVCFLAAVLLIGMYSGYWIEQHWKGQETIYDTVVAHDADEERPGEATPRRGRTGTRASSRRKRSKPF